MVRTLDIRLVDTFSFYQLQARRYAYIELMFTRAKLAYIPKISTIKALFLNNKHKETNNHGPSS